MKRKVLLSMVALLLAISLVATACAPPPVAPPVTPPVTPAPPVAEYEWRFADPFTAKSRHVGEQLFIDLVNAYTDGRIKITLYPDGVLGTHKEIFHLVQSGEIEMMMVFPYVDIVPGGAVNWMPWAASSWWEAERQYAIPDGIIFKVMQDAYNEVGTEMLWGSSFGLYGLGNNVRPLKTPDDLRGLKFRVSGSLGSVNQLLNMGSGLTPAFTVVTMPWADIYGALERGVVDGVWSMWPSLVEERHGEVLKYYTDLNFEWDWYGIIMNQPLFDGLPVDLRDAIVRAGKDAQTFGMWYMQQEVVKFKQIVIEEMGVEVTFLTAEERAVWREKANMPAVWAEIATPWLDQMYPGQNMTKKLLDEMERIRAELLAMGLL